MVLALDFSVLGAVTRSDYSISPAVSLSPGLGFGGGATAAMSLSPFFSLESGVLLLNHSFTINEGTSTQSSWSLRYFDIPLLLRFSPISLIAIEGGAYYGISHSGTSSNDFGFLVGAGIRWPIAPLWKIRADMLYEFGLANLASGSSTQHSRSVDFLAGVMLDIW